MDATARDWIQAEFEATFPGCEVHYYCDDQLGWIVTFRDEEGKYLIHTHDEAHGKAMLNAWKLIGGARAEVKP